MMIICSECISAFTTLMYADVLSVGGPYHIIVGGSSKLLLQRVQRVVRHRRQDNER